MEFAGVIAAIVLWIVAVVITAIAVGYIGVAIVKWFIADDTQC
jgi:hypothetical protein